MDSTHFIKAFTEKIATPQNIVILPHKNPDGDVLGSSLAMLHFLTAKKHKCSIISPNEYPDFLTHLPQHEKILNFSLKQKKCAQLIEEATVIIALDFNTLHRISPVDEEVEKSKATKFLIDHHESPTQFADYIYSDTSKASTCEMVYQVIDILDRSSFTKEIGICLYTGIVTDTGSFRFPKVQAKTHNIVAHLIELGIDHTAIHSHVFDSYSFLRLKLLGIALNNMTQVEGLDIVHLSLSDKELKSCKYKKGDTEGFVNYGLSLNSINISVFLSENAEEGIIKMSFRSKGDFDVNQFARTYFDGGGHKNAAGGMSKLTMEETKIKLEQAFKLEKNSLK